MEFLSEKGFDQNFGARPLRRAIQKYLEDPISEEILKGNLKDAGKIKVKFKKGNDELTFTDDKKEPLSEKHSVDVTEENKDNAEE